MSRAVMNPVAPAACVSRRVDRREYWYRASGSWGSGSCGSGKCASGNRAPQYREWMQQLRAAFSVLVLCGAWAALGACTPAAPPPPPPKAPATTAPHVGEAPQCVDDKDQRVQCIADSDCCPRFVCGKDPDLSQAVDFCIFGG